MLAARFLLFTRRAGAVEWRLISANNRTLATAARAEPDADRALGVIEVLRASAADAPARVVPDGAGGWRWTVTASVEAVAVGARSYLRRIECEMALASFRQAAVTAVVRSEVMTQRTGRRPPSDDPEPVVPATVVRIPRSRSGSGDTRPRHATSIR